MSALQCLSDNEGAFIAFLFVAAAVYAAYSFGYSAGRIRGRAEEIRYRAERGERK